MTHALHLIRRDPARNMARFYRLEVAADLFGGAVLIRRWGRIGSRGQERRSWLDSPARAEGELQLWLARKQRRGYAPG